MLPSLFQAQAVQGWSSGMLQIVDALLADQTVTDGCLLEIGCGSGQFLRHWQMAHPRQMLVGVDLHPLALSVAKTENQRSAVRHTTQFTQAHLTRLPFDNASFDTIVALDVFDQHEVNLTGALAEAKRLLKPCGLLLLRVSAYPWLYGVHDVAFNTGRRFGKEELRHAAEAADFRVQRVTYANALLAAPIIASRFLQKWGWIDSMAGLYESSLTNWLFEQTLALESQWLRQQNLPFGVSLYVVAQRR